MGTLSTSYAHLGKELKWPIVSLTLLVSFCNVINGLDQGWFGGFMGNPYAASAWGDGTLTVAPGYVIPWFSAGQQSTITTTGYAAGMVGAVLASVLTERFGRRSAFYAVAALVTVGATLQITSGVGSSVRWAQLMVGKSFVGLANGSLSMVGPTYLAEVAPSSIRGVIVASSQLAVTVGGILAAIMNWQLSSQAGKQVWEIPIAIQYITVVFGVATALIVPESPRWLLSKGRVNEARRCLARIRQQSTAVAIEEDLQQIQAALDDQRVLERDSLPWVDAFKGNNLKRTLTCVGLQTYQVAMGLAFLQNYLIVLFTQIGIANPYVVSIIVSAVSFGSIIINFALIDIVGRRILLCAGAFFMTAVLISFAALVTKYTDLSGSVGNACAALIVLWFFFFISTWSVVPWTMMNELPSAQLRSKTVGISIAFSSGIAMLIAAVNPYLQDQSYVNLGGKVGFIYGSISFTAIFWAYFMVPETKGRTLEEVDELYRLHVPVRGFSTYQLPPKIASVVPHDPHLVTDVKDKPEHLEGV